MRGQRLLAAWRKRNDLTQVAAARRAGVSCATWCDWENGKKRPSVDLALRLAELTKEFIPVASWASANARLPKVA